MTDIIEVTDANFAREVLAADKPVLVDFWSPGCGACTMLAGTLEAIAALRDDIKIVKVNVGGGANPRARTTYPIQAYPTIYMFREGKIANVTKGALPAPVLDQWINQVRATPPEQDIDAGQYKSLLVQAAREGAAAAEELYDKVPPVEAPFDNTERGETKILLAFTAAAGVALVLGITGALPVATPLLLSGALAKTFTALAGAAIAGMGLYDLRQSMNGKPRCFFNLDGGENAAPVSAASNILNIIGGAALCLLSAGAGSFWLQAGLVILGGGNVLLSGWSIAAGRGKTQPDAQDEPEETAPSPEEGAACEDGVCPLPKRPPGPA